MYRGGPAFPALFVFYIFNTGCAVRQPRTWRLVAQPKGQVLIPPGVASPDLPRRNFTADVRAGRAKCPSDQSAVLLRPRGNRLRVTVDRDALIQQKPGWLRQWTATAESQGCIPPGDGMTLAARILESLPLDPAAAYRLLHANNVQAGFVDLGPENRLQVNSPIMREGTTYEASAIQAVQAGASDHSLTVDIKTSDDLLGVETAWYAVRPKPGAPGYTIVPVSAERSIQGRKETAPGPATNYFAFASQAAYYRLFYKSDRGIMKILIAGAPTRAELDKTTQAIDADPDACQKLAAQMCVLLPQHVAANPYVAVLVNGREVSVPVGSSIRNAIQAAGERDPQRLLPRLTVRRPYAGKTAPVEFDRAAADILALPLQGGEEISWQ